jgi:hypothetical protein
MPTVGNTGGSVQVEGLREAIKRLESLGAQKDELVSINLQAAETLIAAASPLVPRRTGNLASTLRASKTKGYAQVAMGNARVPYANPIHWGWFYDKEWFIQKNIKPNRFLYRALDRVKDKIMADYEQDLQKLFNKYGLGE